MVAFYDINDLTLGPSSHSSGHEAYLGAIYKPSGKKVIYKKNKYGLPIYSRFEVAFSLLAKLFLAPDLTPSQNLVRDEAYNILGLSVQHLCYVIQHKEGANNAFFTLHNPWGKCKTIRQEITEPSQIPIYFLDKLPQGFFARLVNAESKGKLTIDYESLASILATSYTLEEDDLHKGNFGFYLVEHEGKPLVRFFKIDHDLMFVDSIMGFQTSRPFHLFHGPDAFECTVEDLLSFPKLKKSANSYWPTKFSYISNPFNNKEYHSNSENEAFAQLENNPEFIKAKWKAFYKQILIPQDLIYRTLVQGADLNQATDRAYVALMMQATTARLANLRAALFSIKEFRDFVIQLNENEQKNLILEINPQNEEEETQIQKTMDFFKGQCLASRTFIAGDTPLHTAIKLGEYRYDETLRMFGRFLNVKNSAGKTPLDCALELEPEQSAPGENRLLILQHLLEHGAHPTKRFYHLGLDRAQIKACPLVNPYLKQISALTSYADFKNILRDIGEDYTVSLKYKKNLALECIKQWLLLRQGQPQFTADLRQFKKDVNGASSEEECASLKYLRQLRSKLWIIRQIRGLYGHTSTLGAINQLLEQAAIKPSYLAPSAFLHQNNDDGEHLALVC